MKHVEDDILLLSSICVNRGHVNSGHAMLMLRTVLY